MYRAGSSTDAERRIEGQSAKRTASRQARAELAPLRRRSGKAVPQRTAVTEAALGINDGYNSTAALMVDGEIVACASEERFSRHKNQSGYPRKAIEYCLSHAGLAPEQLSALVMGGKLGHYPQHPSERQPLRPYTVLQNVAQAFEYALPPTKAHQRLS